MKKGTKEKQEGITLIALVITIIVLLLLAGVTIATLTGENGLLTRTNSSKVETEKAAILEEANLAKQNLIVDGYLKGEKESKSNLLNAINTELKGSILEGQEIITEDNKYRVLVNPDFTIKVIENTKAPLAKGELGLQLQFDEATRIMKIYPVIGGIRLDKYYDDKLNAMTYEEKITYIMNDKGFTTKEEAEMDIKSKGIEINEYIKNNCSLRLLRTKIIITESNGEIEEINYPKSKYVEEIVFKVGNYECKAEYNGKTAIGKAVIPEEKQIDKTHIFKYTTDGVITGIKPEYLGKNHNNQGSGTYDMYIDEYLRIYGTTLKIPNKIGNTNIIGIEMYAFESIQNIDKVIIEEGITEIGESAFKNCSNLAKLELPNSIIQIRNEAFGDCNIKNINIPNSVSLIESYAFFGNRFEKAYIPESVKNIGNHAMYSNKSNAIIECQAGAKPVDWDAKWNFDGFDKKFTTVNWGVTK